MYESEPKAREGEPLDSVVPEAIHTTASTGSEGAGGSSLESSPLPGRLPSGNGTFAALAGLALIEALVIVLLVTL